MNIRKNIIVFGPPGSGKGTFASQIRNVFNKIIHISTGDIFRENVKKKTKLGLKAKEYMEKGELVPDVIVNAMIRKVLSSKDAKQNGFILDGYPRNLDQSKILDDITDINLFLLLEIPRDILKKRILGRFICNNCNEIYNIYLKKPIKEKKENEWICDNCGALIKFKQRRDDTVKTLENRLFIYDRNAIPIIDYYTEKGIVKRIDATNTLAFSEEEIKKIINS